MRIEAVVTKDELASIVSSLTPLKITIDERRGRAVTLGRPSTISLVPNQGIRIRGDARVQWDTLGVSIPVTLQAWQVLLIPRVISRGRSQVLSLDPVVEELDLKGVPSLFDGKIASAIRDGIAQNRGRLAWDFARTLSSRLPMPSRVAPVRAFEIMAIDGGVSVTETELRLAIRFGTRVERPAAARETSEAPSSLRPELVPAR